MQNIHQNFRVFLIARLLHVTQFTIFIVTNAKSFLKRSDYTKSIPKYLFYKSIWMKQSDIIFQFGLWLFFLTKTDKKERKIILMLTIINDRMRHEIYFLREKYDLNLKRNLYCLPITFKGKNRVGFPHSCLSWT